MFFKSQREKFKNIFLEKVDGPSAKWWLAIISFTESSFFPIPPDPFLMAALKNQNKWFSYSLLITICSVLGGLFGYLIGYAFFETVGKALVDAYHLQDELKIVGEMFERNAFISMFTAAFTPIPYKMFTIAGGLFHINLFTFIIASIFGRGIRFFTVGFLMKVFGERMSSFIFKYFNRFTILVLIIILIYLIFQFI